MSSVSYKILALNKAQAAHATGEGWLCRRHFPGTCPSARGALLGLTRNMPVVAGKEERASRVCVSGRGAGVCVWPGGGPQEADSIRSEEATSELGAPPGGPVVRTHAHHRGHGSCSPRGQDKKDSN